MLQVLALAAHLALLPSQGGGSAGLGAPAPVEVRATAPAMALTPAAARTPRATDALLAPEPPPVPPLAHPFADKMQGLQMGASPWQVSLRPHISIWEGEVKFGLAGQF